MPSISGILVICKGVFCDDKLCAAMGNNEEKEYHNIHVAKKDECISGNG